MKTLPILGFLISKDENMPKIKEKIYCRLK